MDQTPVLIAEELLKLVKRTYVTTPDTPTNPLSPFEAYKSKYQIEDLCGQLLRSVLGPLGYTSLLAESCQESSALGFVTQLSIADLLGDKTMTVQEISDAVGVKVKYLKVAMSCVTKHGYFDEIDATSSSPAYRNNELSGVLKENHPTSLKEAVCFMCDDGYKASSQILPASKIVVPDKPQGRELPAISLAFGFQDSVFEWYTREAWRGKRMGNAMQQLHRVVNENSALDYDWSSLASPIVDVGGGIGSLEMILLRNRPQDHVKFIVFDLTETVENAKKIWKELQVPEHFSVTFQPGNFMAPTFEGSSIPAGKATYIIRHVLHNWSDDGVLHILKQVRHAMSLHVTDGSAVQPKLILCETLLLPTSNRFVRAASMQILSMSNGWTRTEADMIQLLDTAGFIAVKTHRMRADDSIVEATLRPLDS
ncbi:S-adenosyl-L-methionine-dependent methyltransferase [Macrolepiota fuliginosa MF-IS2]|uniref:S-adenosyl-L-methionine-dependent methyltransferase n=1 Tax=Macrolepiota fuliginosa MF-IS2 TaxID=1400762 RepID=A0A9P5X8E9_9AGAR|nr:S-adenosyl-L-methionine-dependent methyltransferase [Macrolepiota fuliginosa MF-IS2]